MAIDDITRWLAIFATLSMAVTGVLAIADRGVDLVSAIILGVITAIGGGTIRDLVLDVPVFWASDLMYVRIAIAFNIATFFARTFFTQPQIFRLMLYIDGLGAALFGVGGAFKTLELGFGWPLAPLMLGVITAIGGGLTRDVLAGRKTLLMSAEIYTLPVILGSLLMLIGVYFFPGAKGEALLAGTIMAFIFRAAAIHWHPSLPDWLITKTQQLDTDKETGA